MKFHSPTFCSGVAWTCFLALLAMKLEALPLFHYFGSLALALILGIAARLIFHIPEQHEEGVHFSAKQLLRIGTVLIGARLNLTLLTQVGWRLFFLVTVSVTISLFFITWIGCRYGLSKRVSLLLAINTSICGGSAVASLAPIVGAKKEEVALVIPLGSLLGTVGVLCLRFLAIVLPFKPLVFGIFAGTTLQEVAQVIATVSVLPAAVESGIIAKLLRVLFLVPIVLGLGFMLPQGPQQEKTRGCRFFVLVHSIWFVAGFLIVGFLHSLFLCYGERTFTGVVDRLFFLVATFLMTMAMAGVGLQVCLKSLCQQGWRLALVGLLGWCVFMLVVAAGILIARF